jgi:phospholipase/carboxylesterase
MNNDPHANQPVVHRGRKLEDAAGAVILIHGRGASAEDILGLAEEFSHPEFAYLAPDAAGQVWYPQSFLSPIAQNEPWLSSALKKIGRIVEDTGMPREKIVIAGFSQGACLATEFVARNPARYGGVIAFTGGLIGPPGTKFSYPGTLDGTPVFFGAGDRDPHVPWQRVEESSRVLSAMGAGVIAKCYPGMPHTINRDEIEHAQRLLASLAG